MLCGSRLHSAAMHALILVLAGGGLLQEPFSPWFLCVSFTFQVILSTHKPIYFQKKSLNYNSKIRKEALLLLLSR